MPVTSVKIGDVKLKFITSPLPIEDKLFTRIELFQCDENFVPIGAASISIHEDNEEIYHENLRKQALEKGHFVAEESTDPQWNPDYKSEESIDNGSESTI